MSKKSMILFSLIIIILIIIALVCIFKKEKKDKVLNMYDKIRNSQNFTFTMEEKSDEIDYKVVMAQRGTDVCIDMFSSDEHTTTLVYQNEAYFIMHEKQEYYNYEDEEIESNIVLSGLHNMTKKEYTSGREEIQGKSYYYEEFDNETTDFIIYANTNETSKVKTRFYFDNDKIVYIKNIVMSEDFSQEELIKVDLKYDVDEGLFEIPSDYAEVEY